MSFTVEKYPDLPVVIITLNEDFNLAAELDAFGQEVMAALDALDEPVYTISDASRMRNTFSEMVGSLAAVTRGNFVSLLKHPMVMKMLVVDHRDLTRLAVNALGQAQYGGFSVAIFRSVDDALEDIRAAVSETAGS